MIFRFLFFSLLIVFSSKSLVFSQNRFVELTKEFLRFDSTFYRQKIFVHTNKTIYNAGNLLRYKAYVVDAGDLKTDNKSWNLFVELFGPEGKRIIQQKLKLEQGKASSFFQLPDTLSGGNYFLRAYTEFMQNFEEYTFFEQEIEITNPQKMYFSPALYKKTKKDKRNKHSLDITFVQLNNIIKNDDTVRLAIRCTDRTLSGFAAQGFVRAKKEKVKYIFTCDSSGTAIVSFPISISKKYKIAAYSKTGKAYSKKLPPFIIQKIDLEIVQNPQKIIVRLKQEKATGNDDYNKKFTLVCRSLGRFISAKPFFLDSETYDIQYDKQKLPTGIIRFYLFDANNKLLDSKFVFNEIEKNNFQKPTIFTNKDSIYIKFNPTDTDEILDYSVSATYFEDSVRVETPTSIKTYFRSFSEINNTIINSKNIYTAQSISENLEKFILHACIINEPVHYLFTKKQADFSDKPGFSIKGHVTHEIIKYPAENINLTMYVLNKPNDRIGTVSDGKGNFSFDGLEYTDSMDVLIEGRTRNDKKMLILYYDKHFFENQLPLKSINFEEKIRELKDGKLYRRKNYHYVHPTDSFRLNRKSLHAHADRVIDFEKINTNGYTNAFEVIEDQIPGFRLDNDNTLRGKNSIMLPSEPLYLIDDVPTDKYAVASLSPNDVERIEILKSPSNTAIYGSRSANGIIAVYTKQGYYVIRGEIQFKTTGYARDSIFNTSTDIEISEKNIESCFAWEAQKKLSSGNADILAYALPKRKNIKIRIVIQGITQKSEPYYYFYEEKLE